MRTGFLPALVLIGWASDGRRSGSQTTGPTRPGARLTREETTQHGRACCWSEGIYTKPKGGKQRPPQIPRRLLIPGHLCWDDDLRSPRPPGFCGQVPAVAGHHPKRPAPKKARPIPRHTRETQIGRSARADRIGFRVPARGLRVSIRTRRGPDLIGVFQQIMRPDGPTNPTPSKQAMAQPEPAADSTCI